MGDCCGRSGYDTTFGSWFSGRVARRYRRRGLDKTAARIVGFIADQGVSGASVLEIGGGVGDIQVELLKRGAVRTTNLELVESYEADAKALAATAGVGDRITRRQVELQPVPTKSRPTTSWSSTAWCVATPTTSGCLARPPPTPHACWCSAIRRATCSSAPYPGLRMVSAGCGAIRFGPTYTTPTL